MQTKNKFQLENVANNNNSKIRYIHLHTHKAIPSIKTCLKPPMGNIHQRLLGENSSLAAYWDVSLFQQHDRNIREV